MKVKGMLQENWEQPFKYVEMDLDEPKDDEVLIRIVACGICRTDFNNRHAGHEAGRLPIVLGHEGSGVVEKVGKNVTNVKAGDQVIISGTYCGECEDCKKGDQFMCHNAFHFDGTNLNGTYNLHYNGKDVANLLSQGTMKKKVIVHKDGVFKIPEGFDLKLGAPLGCGIKTGAGSVLYTLNPPAGSTIAIFGTGTVGNSALMAAKIKECSMIIAVDTVDSRLELAIELGATHTINAKTSDPVAKIKEITNGRGVQFAVDATGLDSPILNNMVKSLENRGKGCFVGVFSNFSTDFSTMALKHITLYAHRGGGVSNTIIMPELLKYNVEGKLPFEKFVKYYDFEDIEQAFEDMLSGKTVKPILLVSEL